MQLYEDVEVYNGRHVGFYVGVYSEVSSYVESYDGVEVCDWHKAGFCVYVDAKV